MSTYIRFLNLIDTLDRMNPGRDLDEIERVLLQNILHCAEAGQNLLVGDLIQLSQLGSQATLHGRVKNLAALGYLKFAPDKEDGRKKLVIPTKMAIKYCEFMSKCIEDAVKI